MTKLQLKFLLVGIVLALSLWALWPTFSYYWQSAAARQELEKERSPILKKILNLGLDLKGGVKMLLALDVEKLPPETTVADALERAIEIIRNRVDQFGVAEPLIVREGERWISVQLPGIRDVTRARELIGKTALLEFRLVDNTDALTNIQNALTNKNASLAEIDKFPEIKKMIPAGYEILPGKENSYFIVKSSPELTGAYLVNARVNIGGDFGYPHVSLEFNKDGAKIFSTVTGANVNRHLAIVLDGIVQSAPVIKTRIPDGKAIIEGNFTMDDAKLLATVLRAGALPAPVKVIEERTIGPTLGEDSIHAGIIAGLVGLVVVVLFMIVYYRLSGVIANLALFLNLIILLGAMAYFRATLTLPGIAGIILTLGMAVDANVLILERIREELAAGKSVRVAVDFGYQKALGTIFDSNLTTLIAAVFLFQFGTGPVKGFAVTLSLGIIISMFTAIFVTRIIYEWLFENKMLEKIVF